MAAAILRAKTYGVARPHWATDPARVAKVVASIAVPEFAPKQVRGGHICKVLSVTWWENRFQSFCPVAQASDSKNMQEGSQGRLRECGVKERERGSRVQLRKRLCHLSASWTCLGEACWSSKQRCAGISLIVTAAPTDQARHTPLVQDLHK